MNRIEYFTRCIKHGTVSSAFSDVCSEYAGPNHEEFVTAAADDLIEAIRADDREKVHNIYAVMAHRHGHRDDHTYLAGLFFDEAAAKDAAMHEEAYRGGKYRCSVWLHRTQLEWQAGYIGLLCALEVEPDTRFRRPDEQVRNGRREEAQRVVREILAVFETCTDADYRHVYGWELVQEYAEQSGYLEEGDE